MPQVRMKSILPRVSQTGPGPSTSRVGTNIFLPLFLSFGVPRSIQDKTRGLQLRIPQSDTGPATRKDEGLMSPETWLMVHLALGIVIGATLPRAREKGIRTVRNTRTLVLPRGRK